MPIAYWHLLHFWTPAEIEHMNGSAVGYTLMDGGLPLGFGGAYFTKNGQGDGIVVAFFYGGPNGVFARKYRLWLMRAAARLFRNLHAMGVQQVYACADKTIPRSDALLRWLGGSPLGIEQDEGEIWCIELAKNPLIRK